VKTQGTCGDCKRKKKARTSPCKGRCKKEGRKDSTSLEEKKGEGTGLATGKKTQVKALSRRNPRREKKKPRSTGVSGEGGKERLKKKRRDVDSI